MSWLLHDTYGQIFFAVILVAAVIGINKWRKRKGGEDPHEYSHSGQGILGGPRDFRGPSRPRRHTRIW